MIILSGDEALRLVAALRSFVGHEVVISEGISREREGRGYDRHSATNSRFRFVADRFVGVSISGQLLGLESAGGADFYFLSLRSVAGFSWEAGRLTVTEHYDEKTARRTVVERAA